MLECELVFLHNSDAGGETHGKAYTSVQLSWMKLKDEIGLSTVGGLFYQKFFALEPEAKALFPLSMRFRYMDWDASEEEDPDDPTHSPALKSHGRSRSWGPQFSVAPEMVV